ncbi:DNA polymerase nu isoform X2 [Halyomorpha halys]|uniref:DNA polymerase nu isoform X2 n=1 Tax=Halyomorpha halys TaxID=286706 RepID=UPI0006D4E4AF|nr:DNA polymerase nu-like isoform X2 [Halyomorpha halys]
MISMEKIWTTKFLPPSINEESELSFSALKIISYLHNSDNYRFPTGLIEKNDHRHGIISEPVVKELSKENSWETPITFDLKATNDEINSSSRKECLFKMKPNNDFLSFSEDVSSPSNRSPIGHTMNESVDMFDDSITQIKNVNADLGCKSDDVHLSKKNLGSINCLEDVINKNFIKNKKKISHYFPIRRKKFPKLTNQEEIHNDFDFNMNSIPSKHSSPMKSNKLKFSYSKRNVRTIDKYFHNHTTGKPCIISPNNDSKRIMNDKIAKNHRSPCVIDFSNFPSGTFKTIKEFPVPTSSVPFNNIINDSEIKGKSKINDISKSVELDRIPGNPSGKDQDSSNNRDESNKEQPMARSILYLNKDNNERANKLLLDQTVMEIGLTLCYREGFCFLNKPIKKHNLSPFGIMLSLRYLNNQEEFIFFSSEGFKEENLKKFLLDVLNCTSQKICCEAKALILYVLDNIGIDDKTVCYDWCLLDPLVAFWLLDPDHPAASFGALLQHFSFSTIEENCWSECCTYLKYQSHVMGYLHSELQKLELWNVFFCFETNIIPILAVMETSSIMVNTEILKKMSTILHEKLTLLEKEAENMAGHKFSFKSPLQISKVLFEELKLDEENKVTIKNMARRGNKSTSESTLKLLGNIHPLPNLILEYRQLWKLKSSYVDTILLHAAKQQSVMAKWDLCATATGRIIATCPNLQAVQKKPIFLELVGKKIEFNLRSCFIAREGCTFVAADFQHIELRMFAHLAKDKILADWLTREDDVFKLITQARLKKAEITSEDRNQTKTLVYALIYGAGSAKLASILSVEESVVEEIKNSLFEMFPCLWNFREKILNEVRKSKVLRSLSGRRRMFQNISSCDLALRNGTERKAINFIIQGSAADICKFTMIGIEKKLRNKEINARLLLQIHDELLWEVRNDNYNCMIGVLEEVMEENKTHFLKEFQIEIPFPIVITSGNNWGNMA